MNSAQKIIEKFGGQSNLAGIIGKGQSTVQHWRKTGVIPAKWQPVLLDAARRMNISLFPSDFIPEVEESAAQETTSIPKATHWGELKIGQSSSTLPCYVLDTGDRVLSLKGVVAGLIETEGGQLAEYIKVKSLRPFLPEDLTPAENDQIPALIRFDTGAEGFTKYAVGVPVEKFMDLCAAYSAALQESLSKDNDEVNLTERQQRIAIRANAFLRSCAKVGIVALVDEATGYQYEREQDALQFKLSLYLEGEMRRWEKTFPDELWHEFGRLTNWKGPVHLRPKYWGKLVMELVYSYLDRDVAKWLKENNPKPKFGQNYHQWLSSQYGLKKLIEHIWMLIGMARACNDMLELREKMAEQYGRKPVQLLLFTPQNYNPTSHR